MVEGVATPQRLCSLHCIAHSGPLRDQRAFQSCASSASGLDLQAQKGGGAGLTRNSCSLAVVAGNSTEQTHARTQVAGVATSKRARFTDEAGPKRQLKCGERLDGSSTREGSACGKGGSMLGTGGIGHGQRWQVPPVLALGKLKAPFGFLLLLQLQNIYTTRKERSERAFFIDGTRRRGKRKTEMQRRHERKRLLPARGARKEAVCTGSGQGCRSGCQAGHRMTDEPMQGMLKG